MTLSEEIRNSLYEHAINNLVDKKFQLDEDFNNGIINYAEYEEFKYRIQNDLDAFNNV